jgi:hypothetical protein
VEWSANVQVDTQQLSGSHLINFYIGGYDKTNPENSQKTPKNLVGSAAVFGGTSESSGFPLNISVPLTHKLVEKNIPLRPEDTLPELSEQLWWSVEKV